MKIYALILIIFSFHFQQTLTAPNSSINANNFDPKLAQAIFDKCVSKEIFQELPDVIDSVSVEQQII